MNPIQMLITLRDEETDLNKQAKIQAVIDVLFEREIAMIKSSFVCKQDMDAYNRLMASLG